MKISEQAWALSIEEYRLLFKSMDGSSERLLAERIQLLLNSEREKIIKECAETLITQFPPITLEEAKDGVVWQRDATVKMRDLILAKLKE